MDLDQPSISPTAYRLSCVSLRTDRGISIATYFPSAINRDLPGPLVLAYLPTLAMTAQTIPLIASQDGSRHSFLRSGYHTDAIESCLNLDDASKSTGTSASHISVPHNSARIRALSRSPDLSILCAETHNEGLRRPVSSKPSDTTVILGVAIRNDDGRAMPEEGPPRKKKSVASKAVSEGQDGRKSRGRPRLDMREENAAERRRTQIRLAQRAYRERKETTIVSLQKHGC